MHSLSSKLNNPLNLPVKVWVLAPFVKTNDENLDYYYDFTQSIDEYTRAFSELGLQWQWQPVTLKDYNEIIDKIVCEKEKKLTVPVVLNLCDGDEVNGTPGISVLRLLKKKNLIFSGAEDFFYRITTSKIEMKVAFDKAGVPTPKWEALLSEEQDIAGIFERLGTPIIIKPSVSGGSMGVGIKNVVNNEEELKIQIRRMFEGYRGWNLVTDGLIAESFIAGQEYTSFLVANYNKPKGAIIYEPVERVFHQSLPDDERFLSFDRLWEIYEEEEAMPGEENFYEYGMVYKEDIDNVKKISWGAYAAVKGTGYARIDIRKDKNSGKLYILEVNAQCGISEDENYTSIGAIIKASGKTFSCLVMEIINNAIERYYSPASARISKAISFAKTSNVR